MPEMHAQSHAIAFCECSGFEAYGDEFLDCEIAHRNLRRRPDATDNGTR